MEYRIWGIEDYLLAFSVFVALVLALINKPFII